MTLPRAPGGRVFLEVGYSEDRDRARERRTTGASRPRPGDPGLSPEAPYFPERW
jgi:hypothetical protein